MGLADNRHWLLRCLMALAVLAGLGAPVAAMAQAAPAEPFVFDDWAGPPLPVWYALPEAVTADTPVVMVMHGVNRDADRYRDEWAGLARQHGLIVVVPTFGSADFPGANGYNTGYFADRNGTPRPRAQWSYAAIEPLFDAVRDRFGTQVQRYTLYGHSAGAQFVHRFVMLMPEARIEQAIAANAGWYMMPDLTTDFPYGAKGAPVSAETLAEALGKPLTVLLGTADTNTAHPNLRTTPEANLQGPHRYARGLAFHAAGRDAAARMEVPFGWRVEDVPGVGHSNGQMAQAAAALIAARAKPQAQQ